MAKYAIEDTTLKGIADAVREKEGTTDAIPVTDIAERISALSGGGSSETYKQLIESGILNDSEMTEMPNSLCRGWQYLTKINLPNVTEAGTYVCYGCINLEEVSMPKCETIGAYSFYNNTALKKIDFPSLTEVLGNVFRQCTDVTSVNLPVCKSLGNNAFQRDALIESVDFPVLESIGATAFDQCSALTAVILRNNAVCTLTNVSAFNSTPIAAGTGFIYVPDNLVDSYKAATNWSTYADQIKPISELEV